MPLSSVASFRQILSGTFINQITSPILVVIVCIILVKSTPKSYDVLITCYLLHAIEKRFSTSIKTIILREGFYR